MAILWSTSWHIWCLVFVIFPLSVVGQFVGPNLQETAVEGSAITLQCRAGVDTSSVSTWTLDGVAFASLAGLALTDGRYDNFEIVNGNTAIGQMDLVLDPAQYDDRGSYSCQFIINGVANTKDAVLTVEAPVSSVTIFRDGNDVSANTISVTDDVEIDVCTAFAARPAVQIQWYNGATEISGNTETTRVNAGNANTTDTISTLKFTPMKADNGKRLLCQTTGQVAAPSQSQFVTLNVQYIPEVQVTYADGTITCTVVDANPSSGITYNIILNDTMSNPGSTLAFNPDDNFCTAIRCNATNTIGTGTDEIDEGPICPGGLTTGAIIGIAVGVVAGICLVLLLIIFCYVKKLFCFDSNKTSSSGNNTLTKKQPSVVNTDMIRNQTEVRQSVHKYDDEPKKPRILRSSSDQPVEGDKRPSPEHEALRRNAPPEKEPKGYSERDAYDGRTEPGHADIEFKNRPEDTNGEHIHPSSVEPTQYRSILV